MPRKPLLSPCWPTRHSTSAPRTCRPQPAPAAQRSSVKYPMPRRANLSIHPRRTLASSRISFSFSSLRSLRLCDLRVTSFSVFFLFLALATVSLSGCSRRNQSDPSSLTFLIESSPTNLDPRFATDSQSQRIDGLLFSGLLERDNQMNFHGDLAEPWLPPAPLPYVFHLRRGVRFHDGRALTAADVKATFEFIMNPANKSPKRGALRMVTSIETHDDATVIFHLSQPFASFSVNLIPSAIGIVPANAGADFFRHPVGSGPLSFVRRSQHEEWGVVRNPESFRDAPQISRVRFRGGPDGVVRALELRKGSADLEM